MHSLRLPATHPFTSLPMLLLAMVLSSLPARGQGLIDLPLNPDANGEEVQRPIPFSEQELRVIRHLDMLPTERLVELLVVYDKLNNDAMCSILARQILKRDPQNAEALRISGTLNPDEEVRPAGYLESLTRILLSGNPVHDTDGVAVQANTLVQDDRPDEAVKLLEALRRLNFPNQPFPYRQDLAEAYQDAGQYEKASTLYQDLIQDPSVAAVTKQEAHKSMAVLAVQQKIATLRAEALRAPEAGLKSSARFLDSHPADPLVIAFRVECLNNAGQFNESIRFLEDLKDRQAEGPFAHLDLLAFTQYGAKNFSEARRVFNEVKAGPYPEPTRTLASQMLNTIRMDEKLEKGSAALKKNDLTAAMDILVELEKEFPKAPDVFAFRCLVEAKSGQSAEVLERLRALQQEAASKGEVFKGMDTLADVQLERKEYDRAIDSYRSIVSDARYDASMRAEAARDLLTAQQQKKIAAAYREIENGNLKPAEHIYAELKSEAPTSPEVELLGADLKLSRGKAREALSDYQRLKGQSPSASAFSGQGGIASAHHRLGEWEEALVAYDEILNAPGFDPQEKWSATWDRRGLLPLLKPTLSLETSALGESDGNRYTQSLAYTTSWWNQWRLIFSARQDSIRLDDATTFLQEGSADFLEGELAVQRRFRGGYFASVSAGGSEEDVLYGASVGRFSNSGVGWASVAWSLTYTGNKRADYGLPLQLLNGREDRVEFAAEGYLHPRVRYSGQAYASRIHVDGDDLGESYGISSSIDYILLTETRKRPGVAIGYAGTYSRFDAKSQLPGSVTRALSSPEQVRRALAAGEELHQAVAANHGREIFESLVDPETNRHGIQASISKRLDTIWNLSFQAGVYRDFADEAWEYTVAAGVEYWLNDRAMLYLDLQHDSDGLGAASDEGVWQASLGAEVSF